MNFDGSFWCIDPSGKALDPVKFQDAPKLECFPLGDWTARKNWERAIR